jgi:integrase
LIKGLHFVRSAPAGKPITWYVYAHRGGPRILKHVGPNKPKLTRAEVAKLLAAMPGNGDEGTLGAVIRKFRRAPEWTGLEPTTRKTWGHQLDLIESKWAKTPVAVWNDPRMVAKVIDWRDSRASTPRPADIGVTVLSRLLEWARLRAIVRVNVAQGVPAIYKGGDRAEIIWTTQDAERFAQAAAQPLRDVLNLAMVTGFRRADLAGVNFDEVTDHAIVRIATKKSRGKRRRAIVPLTPAAHKVLAELRTRERKPGVVALLVTASGEAWHPDTLSREFGRVRDAAGIVHSDGREKHLHDCRGTFVTHLCRVGLTDKEIADIVAWSPENVSRVRRLYVDDAAVVVALAERIANASVK